MLQLTVEGTVVSAGGFVQLQGWYTNARHTRQSSRIGAGLCHGGLRL